jgi:hypothetical protein
MSFSNPIQMLPNGLEYRVSVSTSPTPRVGPPATFPVEVTLRDTETSTIIAESRAIDIGIMNALGAAGLGQVGTTNHRLDRGRIQFEQSYTRAENVYVTVSDSTGLTGQSPIFTIGHDGYKRLQIVAPGEVVEPGVPAFATTGKSGAADPQRSGEPFPMTVRAVDQYWNLADSTASGVLRLVASDNSFSIPGNPDVNLVPFVNGRRTFNGFLTDHGTVTVTVFDEADVTKPSQSVGIPVEPPYAYEITVPASASTGPVPGFQVTVRLVDPVTQTVVQTAQNRFTMTPLLPNRAPANGALGIPEAQLVNGYSVINNQSYDTVEDIIIRVSDDFGREAFSSVIEMDTGGLYYAVTVPDSATVGPPSTFTLAVELIDGNTGGRVRTQDRLFDIQVHSAGTGLPGTGSLGVQQGLLDQGYRSIAESYTKAEDIFIEVSDSTGVRGISNTCRMLADGFKRLQIVAPGETPDPGALTGTGKTGEILTQQAEVPFVLSIRAVDQYWNLMSTVNDGSIELSSSGGVLDLVDPGEHGAPFVNGSRDIGVVIGDPGLVAVFATDPDHPNANTGRVDIPVNEAEYRIFLPEPPVVTAGPPATFTLIVQLVNPLDEQRINAGNDFTMTAFAPDRTPARSTLGITQGTLVAGEAIVSGQNYSVSEDIVIRVTDARGRETYSDVLTVVPVGVAWEIEVPDSVVAGEPWTMSVSRVDIVTRELVTGDDRSFVLTAWSGNAPRPDFNLTPPGILADSVGTTVQGIRTFSTQRYDRAEPIFLRLTDEFQGQAFSDVITVLAAPASELTLWVEDVPGQPLARPLRPNQVATAVVSVGDRSGNPVSGLDLTFRIVRGDARLGSAQAAEVTVASDPAGRADVDLTVIPFGREDALVEAIHGDLMSNQVLVDIIGPPLTVVSFDPPSSPFGDGFYIAGDTRIMLSASTEDPGGIQAIFADVDVLDPPRPTQTYTGPFSLRDLGLDTPGVHTLRFFAEEVSGVLEEVKTVELYLGTSLTTSRPITNRPNPFRAGEEPTVILFNPDRTGTVTVSISDLYGDQVLTHQLDVVAGETAQFVWDGRNGAGHVVANGGYICRIFGDGLQLRRKIAVVK